MEWRNSASLRLSSDQMSFISYSDAWVANLQVEPNIFSGVTFFWSYYWSQATEISSHRENDTLGMNSMAPYPLVIVSVNLAVVRPH